MKINPEDYQEEKKETIDISLTKEEKIKLFFYLLFILFGVALLLGLFESGEIVSHQHTINMTIQNITQNVTLDITGLTP